MGYTENGQRKMSRIFSGFREKDSWFRLPLRHLAHGLTDPQPLQNSLSRRPALASPEGQKFWVSLACFNGQREGKWMNPFRIQVP